MPTPGGVLATLKPGSPGGWTRTLKVCIYVSLGTCFLRHVVAGAGGE